VQKEGSAKRERCKKRAVQERGQSQAFLAYTERKAIPTLANIWLDVALQNLELGPSMNQKGSRRPRGFERTSASNTVNATIGDPG
jgi:hypothetical protein